MRPVWKWSPDWANGVRETLTWKTAIQTAGDGTESRQRIQVSPRCVIGFETLVSDVEYQNLSVQLRTQHVDEWIVPVWWDVSELLFSAAAGGTTLAFNAANRDFRSGGFAVLLDPWTNNAEAVEISESLGVWSTSEPLKNDWSKGARIYPARAALLSTTQSLSQVTDGDVRMGVECRCLDARNHAPSARPDTLEMLEPNRIRPVLAAIKSKVGELDFGVGVFSQKNMSDRAFRTSTYDYLLTDRAALSAIRRDLSYLAGRLGTLNLPTFQSELTPTVDVVSPSELYMYCQPYGFEESFDADTDRFYIKPLSGSYGPAIVEAYGVYPGGETYGDEVEFTPNIGLTFDKSDVKISITHKSRLASDSVEITHITPEVSSLSLSYRSVK